MEINRLADLRPRFVWDILDDTFDLYRERFAPLCGAALIACLPFAITKIALAAKLAHITATGGDAGDLIISNLIIALPFQYIASVIGGAAISVIVRDRLQGQTTTIGNAYRQLLRHAGPLLGATLIVILLGMLGILTVGIGSLAVFAFASFVGPAVVIEGRGARSAWRRSYDLAGSDFVRLLGVLCLMLGMVVGIGIFLAGVLQIVYTVVPTAGDPVAREIQQQVASGAATNLAYLLLSPLPMTAAALFYYDLRVRREGLDLAAQAEALGVTLAPDPFGDISSARVVLKQRKEHKRLGKKAHQTTAARGKRP